MEKLREQTINYRELKKRHRKEILNEYFRRLPFIHFTTLKVKYNDGLEKSTGVESSFKNMGVISKTSAVALDIDNLDQSLEDAFSYFYHHSERRNRDLIKKLNIKKARQSLPGIVIVENIGQELVGTAPIDNPGHVFLNKSGPESIMAVVKLDEEFSPLETRQTSFQKFDILSYQKYQQRRDRIKKEVKEIYLNTLTRDILERIRKNKDIYSQDKIENDIDKLVRSELLSFEKARQFKESLSEIEE